MTILRGAAVACVLAACPPTVLAGNATVPLTATSPYPTIENLSLVWEITGDDNANGVVAVRYRKSGGEAWRQGLPLFRIPAGSNDDDTVNPTYGAWRNKHAGSILDLEPGTTYEIELTLTDPDGGGTVQALTATTRPVPRAAASSTVVHVTPATFAARLSAAEPGQILLLGAGTYPAFALTRSGTSALPLVIRGESAAAVTFDGTVNLDDQQWVHLENVTVQGAIRLDGGRNMAVRGCTVHSSGNGIDAEMGERIPENNYIADNDVRGPCQFTNDQLSSSGCDAGEGIIITGPGNVVCYNHVQGFRDDLTHMEADEAYDQQSNDFYGNDVEQATDDAIEADSSMGNVRVLRNRITNAFDGISSQPGLGGPTYLIRNVMYNVLYTPFKLHNGTVGDVILHNTVVKNGDGFMCASGATVSRLYMRNNLIIGGKGGGTYGCCGNGSGMVLDDTDHNFDATCTLDYDGYGAIGIAGFTGRVAGVSFESLADLQSRTTEKHAVQVDMGVFAATVTHPQEAFPSPLYSPPDLRPRAGGAAIDRGLVLPGVNDGFSGSAPDLGAYEAGSALPWYGPRPAECVSDGDCVAPPACHAATGATCGGGTCSYPVTASAACDDGNGCTSGDQCNGAGACQGGTWICTTPQCSGGAVTAACSCGSSTVASGYCCGGVPQASACACTTPPCGPGPSGEDGVGAGCSGATTERAGWSMVGVVAITLAAWRFRRRGAPAARR